MRGRESSVGLGKNADAVVRPALGDSALDVIGLREMRGCQLGIAEVGRGQHRRRISSHDCHAVSSALSAATTVTP